MSFKISLHNYHKMSAPAVIGVAKNDTERASIGKQTWVNQLKVKGSVVWNEDTTPTLLSNMKTYLPMNNFGSTYSEGGNMVYDYKKNIWWRNEGQTPSKDLYNGHLGSKLNNTQPPLTHLPSGDRRTCTTTRANAHMNDAKSRLNHIFWGVGATHKPNNDTGYLGKNYSVSMMVRIDRNASGALHQFDYSQASHQESWKSGSYNSDVGQWFMKGTHVHRIMLLNKDFYIFTEAQGSTGDTHNNYLTGLYLKSTQIPNNQWFHLLITVEGTQVQYHIIPHPLNGYTGAYLYTSLASIQKIKKGKGCNFVDNRTGGTHRGEWTRIVGNGIRVSELRGYNTNIRAGTKSAFHMMNHRHQIGDLPSNNTYPDEFIGDEVNAYIPDEATAYYQSEKNNLSTDISDILVGNYSNNMILDKFGEFDSTHGSDFYSNVDRILNQERYLDEQSDLQYNLKHSEASQEITEVKTLNNIDNI